MNTHSIFFKIEKILVRIVLLFLERKSAIYVDSKNQNIFKKALYPSSI